MNEHLDASNKQFSGEEFDIDDSHFIFDCL